MRLGVVRSASRMAREVQVLLEASSEGQESYPPRIPFRGWATGNCDSENAKSEEDAEGTPGEISPKRYDIKMDRAGDPIFIGMFSRVGEPHRTLPKAAG
jgi:hypothetical protein